MKRTNIYLSDKQRERLVTRSQNEGVPVSELVRRAVNAYLAHHAPQATGLYPCLERQGYYAPHYNLALNGEKCQGFKSLFLRISHTVTIFAILSGTNWHEYRLMCNVGTI